jgi:hypothetical protein
MLLMLVTLSSCKNIQGNELKWWAIVLSILLCFLILYFLIGMIYGLIADERELSIVMFCFLCLLCPIEYKLYTQWGLYDTETTLKFKIQDIQHVRQELTQKQGEAVKTKEKYRKDVALYKDEINKLRENFKILSYQGASANHRIKGNILLIQQGLAYIQSIEEIQNGIEAGIESLTTTERKIQGDLTYVKLLDKEKANRLLQEITRAIDANKQYVGEFVIKIDENKLKSPEKIWNEIVSGNL